MNIILQYFKMKVILHFCSCGGSRELSQPISGLDNEIMNRNTAVGVRVPVFDLKVTEMPSPPLHCS